MPPIDKPNRSTQRPKASERRSKDEQARAADPPQGGEGEPLLTVGKTSVEQRGKNKVLTRKREEPSTYEVELKMDPARNVELRSGKPMFVGRRPFLPFTFHVSKVEPAQAAQTKRPTLLTEHRETFDQLADTDPRSVALYDDVVRLAPHLSNLPPDVRARVRDQLLEPLAHRAPATAPPAPSPPVPLIVTVEEAASSTTSREDLRAQVVVVEEDESEDDAAVAPPPVRRARTERPRTERPRAERPGTERFSAERGADLPQERDVQRDARRGSEHSTEPERWTLREVREVPSARDDRGYGYPPPGPRLTREAAMSYAPQPPPRRLERARTAAAAPMGQPEPRDPSRNALSARFAAQQERPREPRSGAGVPAPRQRREPPAARDLEGRPPERRATPATPAARPTSPPVTPARDPAPIMAPPTQPPEAAPTRSPSAPQRRAGVQFAGLARDPTTSRESFETFAEDAWRAREQLPVDRGALVAALYEQTRAVSTPLPLKTSPKRYLEAFVDLADGRPAGTHTRLGAYRGAPARNQLARAADAFERDDPAVTGRSANAALNAALHTGILFARDAAALEQPRVVIFASVDPDQAPAVARVLLQDVVDNAAHPDVFLMKVDGPYEIGTRSGGIRLYASTEEGGRRAAEVVAAFSARNAGFAKEGERLFVDESPKGASRLTDGVALGYELPGDMGFLSLRARIVADALDSGTGRAGTRGELIERLNAGLADAGLDPDRPEAHVGQLERT